MAQIEKSAILITKNSSGDEIWIYPITTSDNVMHGNQQVDTIISTVLADIEDLKNRKLVVDSEINASSQNPVQNSTIYLALNGKVDKVTGKGLSTNDYTTAEKGKLESVATSATRNIIDSSLTSTGTNAVQGKIIYAEIQAVNNRIDNIITDAPEAFDTFKEIADYISSHRDEYDALVALSNNKVDKVEGKGLSTNDYTTAEKNKLAGIAASAEVNQNAFSNVVAGSTTAAASSKTDTFTVKATGAASVSISGKELTIGATNTTYATATTAANGLMSKDDKTKLDGVATGAEVNQNAFSNVKVGSTTAAASAKTDTLTLKASGAANVSISGKEVTIGATNTTYGAVTTAADGLMLADDKAKLDGITPGATSYANATTAVAGLMSTVDKTKLDGVATGAEVNQNAFSNVKVGTTTAAANAKTDTLEIAGSGSVTVSASGKKITVSGTNTTYANYAGASASADGTAGLVPPASIANRNKFLRGDATWQVPTDTTYAAATTAANGLMSSADKTKLDGVATGAEVNQNAFSSVKVGTTTANASAKTDTLTVKATGAATVSLSGKELSIGATNTTYAVTNTTAAGLAPKLSGGTTCYLRGDGTWVVPPDTTYATATTSANGLMSSNDKAKLDDVASSAEVNQNAFSNVKVGSTTASADDKTDTLTVKATGAASVSLSGKELTIDATNTTYGAATGSALGLVKTGSNITNSSGTISLTKANVTTALGYAPPDTNTTYAEATTNTAGLMSASDKTKLDGVATGAEVNQNAFGKVVAGTTTVAASDKVDSLTLKATGAASVSISGKEVTIGSTDTTYANYVGATASAAGVAGLVPPSTAANRNKFLRGDATWQVPTNTTYAAVTTAANGLMTAADKIKLDGVTPGATSYAAATQSADGLMSSADKTKLDGVETGANKTIVDTAMSTTSTNPVQNKVVDAAIKAVETRVTTILDGADTAFDTFKEISDWIDTHETEFEALQDLSANKVDKVEGKGLSTNDYTTAEKNKLAGIASGAEVNQNAFSNVKVGSTTAAAGAKTDTLEIAGSGSVTVSASGKKITVSGTNTTYAAATTAANGLMSSADKTKLDGITEGATTYAFTNGAKTLAWDTTSTIATVGGVDITVKMPANPDTNTTYAVTTTAAAGLAPKLSGGTTSYLRGDGTWQVPTNTTYAAVTTAANGLMTKEDKIKLNGVATGAEVNQNAFSNVVVGTTTAAAGAKTDSLTVKASGAVSVSLSGKELTINSTDTTYAAATGSALGLVKTGSNITNSSGTISLTKANVTAALGYAPPSTDTNTTYATATSEANGLMSKDDKAKLDGVATGAEVNQNAFSSVVVGTTTAAAASATDSFTVKATGAATVSLNGKELTINSTNTTYAAATGSALGLVKTGNNITNSSGTISLSKANVTAALGYTPPSTDTNTTYAVATTAADGLMSSADKTKLDGVAENANNYVHPTATAKDSGLYKVAVDGTGHVTAATAVAKADITGLGIPAQDTTYATATTSANGLMSKDDKTKLNGVATGAEVNQNAFSNVKVGETTAAASAKTDTLTVKATGAASVSLSGKELTIDAVNTTYANYVGATASAAGTAGLVPPSTAANRNKFLRGDATWQVPTNTTYAAVTTVANGLMTKEDKIKLNGIAENANNYTHPTATSQESGLYKVAVDGTGHVTAATAVAKADITGLGIPAQDTTYAAATGSALGLVKTGSNITNSSGTISLTKANVTAALGYTPPSTDTNTTYDAATTAAAGLMSAADKIKLNGVAENANNYVHPTATAKNSGLYKVAVDGTGHVTAATAVAKADITGLGIPAQDTTYAAATGSALGLIKTGSNITNSSGTISLTKANVTAALGYTPPSTNTTYDAATTAANGLMSAADKIKLNGIAEGANNYTHPTATAKTSGLYKVAVDGTGHVTAATAVAKADITALGIPGTDTNTTYDAATTAAAGLMSAADKIKLNGVAENANNYVHPTATAKSSGLYKVAVDGTGHVTAATAVAKADITGLGIPAQDTTYAAVTTAANGLMSKDDKIKLNGIAANANNYTHPTATSQASGLYKVAVDGTGHVTAATAVAKADITALGIPGTDTNTTYANYVGATASAAGTAGLVPSATTADRTKFLRGDATWQTPTNTTYAAVTTAANGLMSAADKIKLNGIAENANNYTHPTATSKASGLYKVAVDGTGHVTAATAVAKADITGLGIPAQDTTYAAATTGAAGLMSADDKIKLNGVAEGANNYVHPTATSKASGLYKVTVDGTGHVTAATAVAKSDITGLGIPAQDTTYAAATGSALGLVKTGSNITNSSGTISLTKANVTAALGYTPPSTDTNTTYGSYVGATTAASGTAGLVPAATTATRLNFLRGDGTWQTPTNTTYAAVTTAANGLMTKEDKIKLNGVAENANNYVHPTATSKASGLYKVTVDGTGHVTAATAVAKTDITGLGIPAQDTTYAAATGSALGLVKIGSNISNSSGTISLTKANVTAALGYTPPTTDTNTTYASLKNPNALTIGNKSYDGSEAIDGGIGVYYKTGTGTAAVTTSPYTFAKWDCTDERVTELYDGLMMLYKVPVAGNGTYGTCFQVNSLGYHPVVSVVNTMVGTRYGVNSTILLVYDSTVSANVYNNSTSAAAIAGVWRVVNDYDSGNTNTVPSVQCETAAATAAKAGTCTNYTLTANTYVFINFRYANSSNTAITLNINSKGAKPIYINGAASSTTNYTLPAGTYIAYYNGTNFYFRTDGLLPGNYGGTAMKLDTATTLGKGLVPTLTGSTSVYLNGNGAWTTPTNTTYAAATDSALGLVKVGSNITNSSGTISLTKANVTAALGYTPPTTDTNTTYDAATTAAAGLMSAVDKIKLNGVAENANNYVHPTATAKNSGLYKVAVDGTGHVTAATAVAKADITGLGIPAQDTTYAAVTTAANGLMSKDDKIKLNGIAANANNYSHPTATSQASGLYKITVDGTGHVTAATAVAKADITALGIPGTDTNTTYANYVGATASAAGTAGLVPAATTADRNKFLRGDATWQVPTNTTYAAVTTTANGLMTAVDKIKLNGIAEGANNYTHPTATAKDSGLYKVAVDGTGHVTAATAVAKADITGLGIPAQDTTYAAATASALGLVKIGSNISNSSGTISLSKANVTAALGYTPPTTDTNTTYDAATTAVAGLMSAADKIKLDGVAENANNYVHPTATAKTSGLYKVAVDGTGHVTAATAVAKADITALGIPGTDTNTTYAAVTTAANGLMTKEDKIKLNGVAENANNYVHPTATSKASGLYKVAVDGTGHVTAATAVAKADITALGIPGTDTNTTYAAATTGVAGLMSADDKIKLNGIAENANNYVHPTATSKASGLYKVTVDGTGHVTAATAVAKADITGLGIPAQDTTYAAATGSVLGLVKTGSNITNSSGTISLTKANVTAALGYTPPTTDTNTTYAAVTTSANGLMTAADKIKLDTLLDLVTEDKSAGSTDLIYGLILATE